MHVLIIGMNPFPNQFSRALDSYEGVTWERVSANPGGRIPRCDAAIFVKGQLSHGKYWDAKDSLKKAGKRFFEASLGFTEIAGEFESFLAQSGLHVRRKRIVHAEAAPSRADEGFLDAEDQKEVRSPEERAQSVRSFVEQRVLAGKNNAGIVAELDAEGWVKRGGAKYTKADVATVISKYGMRNRKPKMKEVSGVESRLQLIAKVIAANLDPARKLELIEEIHAGVRTTESQVIAERKEGKLQLTVQSIFATGDQPLLLIDRVSALAILATVPEIKKFADDPTA